MSSNYLALSLDGELEPFKMEIDDRIQTGTDKMLGKGAASVTITATITILNRTYERPFGGGHGSIPVIETKSATNITWKDSNTEKINQSGDRELISVEGRGWALVPIGGQMTVDDLEPENDPDPEE